MECVSYRSHKSGHLLGFADIYIEKWGVEIQGVRLFQKDGRRWVSLPSNEYEKDGEKKYAPFLRFPNKDHWNEFMRQAKDCIEDFCSKQGDSFQDLSESAPF